MKANSKISKLMCIIITLFFAAIVVFITLDLIKTGLPNHPNTDETITSNKVISMVDSGNYILTYFRYPGLNFYYGIIVSNLLSKFGTDINYYTIRVIYVLTALLSNICILLAVKKHTRNDYISCITFCLSMCGLYLYQNLYYAGPDTLIYAFGNLSLLLIIYIYYSDNEDKNIYLYNFLYCIVVGLATSVKFHGILMIVPLVILHFHKKYHKSYSHNFVLILDLLFIPIVFVICNFSMFTNFQLFLDDILFNVNHYMSGHAGLDDPAAWYTYAYTFLFNEHGWIGGILAIFGFIVLIKKRQIVLAIVLLSIPLITILFLGRYSISLQRNISFCMPYIYVFIGVAIYHLFKMISSNLKNQYIKYGYLVGSLIIGFMIVYNTGIISYISLLPDSRVAASEYIANNIPEGSTILTPRSSAENGDFYMPAISTEKYNVVTDANLLKSGDYIVYTSYHWRRYYSKTHWFQGEEFIYESQRDIYENIFSRYSLEKSFTGEVFQTLYNDFGQTGDVPRLDRDVLSAIGKDVYTGPTIDIYRCN